MNLSSPYRRFVFLFVVSAVFWWHSLAATFALALRNNAYTHIFLIVPISVALIVLQWRSRKAQPEPNIRAGLALLVLAVLIGVIGARWWAGGLPPDDQLSLARIIRQFRQLKAAIFEGPRLSAVPLRARGELGFSPLGNSHFVSTPKSLGG